MAKREYNAKRNREMLAAHEAGSTIPQLAEAYALSTSSIGSILTGERHRRAVSPDPYYRALRIDAEASVS